MPRRKQYGGIGLETIIPMAAELGISMGHNPDYKRRGAKGATGTYRAPKFDRKVKEPWLYFKNVKEYQNYLRQHGGGWGRLVSKSVGKALKPVTRGVTKRVFKTVGKKNIRKAAKQAAKQAAKRGAKVTGKKFSKNVAKTVAKKTMRKTVRKGLKQAGKAAGTAAGAAVATGAATAGIGSAIYGSKGGKSKLNGKRSKTVTPQPAIPRVTTGRKRVG